MIDRLVIAGFELPAFLASIDPSLIWMAAVLAGVAYAIVYARRSAIEPRQMYWLSVWALLGGMWGAHLLGLSVYSANGDSLAWLRFWTGGKSYFGGIFGGILGGAIYLRSRRLSLLAYADAVVPAVALGYGIGRLGCFLNGCDFGTPSSLPWAVQYPPGTEAQASHLASGLLTSTTALSLPVHPVQLYASVLGFGLFLFLRRWKFREIGSRYCLFAVSYGAARFAFEWLRGDAAPALGPLSLFQICSLILALSGVCVWFSLPGNKSIRAQWFSFSRFWEQKSLRQSKRA